MTSGAINWVTSWAASVQGPYPVGNPSFLTDLSRAFPVEGEGSRDQTFRLIVTPGHWGGHGRIRLSNAFGTRPVTFEGVHIGLQWSGAQLLPGTNHKLHFAGAESITIPPGGFAWSDPVALEFVKGQDMLAGRKLAVSFHVKGASGPMTWHAKGLQSSYLTWPGAGSRGHELSEANFPFAMASWFFLDAVDMSASPGHWAVVAFGDSITDGTGSTLNGDDRWPDVLERRLGGGWSVLNAGIGGNQVTGPAVYSPQNPFMGGPSALQRLERDVLGLSGVRAVIWLEGINDFSCLAHAKVEDVIGVMREGVARMRAAIPGVTIIGGTVTSALGSSNPDHGFERQDEKRRQLNDFIRASNVFDHVIDFDKAILDPETGGMKAQFVPDNTLGGPGDGLHPNRLGYQAMGACVDLGIFGVGAR